MEKRNCDDKVFIGLDMSMTETGVCLLSGTGDVIKLDLIKTKPKNFDHDIQRFCHIADTVVSMCQEHGVDLVGIETVFSGKNAGSAAKLYGLAVITRYKLLEAGFAYYDIAPTAGKKYCTGKGNAPKDIMMLSVYKNFKEEITNNNQADAFIMSHLARSLYCETEGIHNEIHKYQKEVVDKILKEPHYFEAL